MPRFKFIEFFNKKYAHISKYSMAGWYNISHQLLVKYTCTLKVQLGEA